MAVHGVNIAHFGVQQATSEYFVLIIVLSRDVEGHRQVEIDGFMGLSPP